MTLSCTVTAKGTLVGCSTTDEDPPNFGFGEAALKISKFFKLKPQTIDGKPTEGGTFRRTIRFNLAN